MTDKYTQFHLKLAKKFDLSVRDIRFFRGFFFNKSKDRSDLAEYIQARLPFLKEGKSYRYDIYLNRLAFLSKCDSRRWDMLNKKFKDLETTNNN